jgi:hypothetical protein
LNASYAHHLPFYAKASSHAQFQFNERSTSLSRSDRFIQKIMGIPAGESQRVV